jgi:hypothetical protein
MMYIITKGSDLSSPIVVAIEVDQLYKKCPDAGM